MLQIQNSKMQKSNEALEQIITNVRTHVQHMKDLSENNALVERMTGITNETFKVTLKDSNVPAVIYRRFGQSKTNLFLDRETEKIIYKHVSNEQLGPKIYCYIGEHIRIQQFVESRVLKSQDMLTSQAIENVAFTLQKFHTMSEPQKIQRKSLFRSVFFEKGEQLLEIIRQKMAQDIYSERQKQLIEIFKQWMNAQEIQFVREAVHPLEQKNLGFSHNDLLANNILIKDSNSKYLFIDFEYSTYNYPIFDIANYFGEFQFDYDLPEAPFFGRNNPPQNIQQLRVKFITCYCIAHKKTYAEYKQALNDEQQKQKVQKEVNHFLNQFALGTMLSNLMWGWWAVIVCKNPNINFDYLQFCKVRYDNYLKIKNSGQWKINS